MRADAPQGDRTVQGPTVEGAHDANAAATDAGTTTYIGTIERLEGSGTIVGKAMN